MEIPIYTIDAFTAEPFKGNPAAVCLLDRSRPADWMQRVAAELNLSETAFVVPRASEHSTGEGGPHADFDLRWFTPTVEVPLCGHATLASAHTLWESGKLAAGAEARFHTLSGWLTVRRAGDQSGWIEMDFPSVPVREVPLPAAVQRAFNVQPKWVGLGSDHSGNDRNFVIELESEAAVRALQPNFMILRQHVETGVIVTARATTAGLDFVSRYFGSYAGIDEDPVTGSAHCSLAPYWAGRLDKTEMTGYQVSARGGEVRVRLRGDRVLLAGRAVTVLRGSLFV